MAILFLFAAPVIVISYALYVFNPANADNIFLYVILVIADLIGMIAVMGLWLTILIDVIVPDHHSVRPQRSKKFLDRKPTVDVLVTVFGEPLKVVNATLQAATEISYPHNTFVLDDKGDPNMKKLAEHYGAYYVARPGKEFAKAGNINYGLKYSTAEFFVILDADQVAKPQLIDKLIMYGEDPKIAMVQSPQTYKNTHEFIASGTAHSQEIFYKYVLPAKNVSNSVFCVGTNVLFRRSAIDEIGGIAEISHSEDIWTAYQLHRKGWKTVFVNKVLAVGEAPSEIIPYFKQQLRWAKGGLGILLTKNPLRERTLTVDQRLQYFLSTSFFLVGIAIVVYTLFPLAYLFFEAKPLQTDNPAVWLLHYIPYVGLYYFLSWLLLGRLLISSLSVAISSFYPYILGLISVLFDTEQQWVATTASKSSGVIMKWIWPHVLILILTPFALFVGWYEPGDFWVTVFYSVLALWNFYLIYIFVTGNKRIVKN